LTHRRRRVYAPMAFTPAIRIALVSFTGPPRHRHLAAATVEAPHRWQAYGASAFCALLKEQ
jgi:hypothetical protein